MIHYILEVLAFQLLFLLVYDLFLKKETFFNWNRIYLIATSLVSLLIPFITFSAITTAIPEQYTYVFPVFGSLQEVVITGEEVGGFNYQFQWEHVLYLGMVVSFGFLLFKFYKINLLLRKGKVIRLSNYTKVLLSQSKQAFSFFKYIFLGDAIVHEEHEKIIEHELVHVQQKHSIDLLYFEILRVIFWFNPLIYVYQNRIAELHEFIADAQAVKTYKQDYVNELLSQAFQVQHISFVNQFLKPSLLKKRLKMISRQQSKAIFKLKYLFLVPLVFGMLVYTSCERVDLGITEELNNEAVQSFERQLYTNDKVNMTPFAVVEEVPIFPGCENASNQRACFQEKIQNHIRKNFRYPEEAQAANIQGRVYVNFVIGTDGAIESFRMRSPHKLLGDEAERIINRLPKFIPGKQDGKAVNVPFSIPITFKLGDSLPKNSAGFYSIIKSLGDKRKVSRTYEKGKDAAVGLDNDIMLDEAEVFVPFAVIEEVPEFPGCENAVDKRPCFQESIKKHIRKNFRYPPTAQKSGVQGRVYVHFVIDENGNIGNIKMRGPDSRLSEEARRIIERLPKLKAGRQKGKAVNVSFSIPITFKLQSSSATKQKASIIPSFSDLSSLWKSEEKFANVKVKESVNRSSHEDEDVPFSVVDEVPVFEGCEGNANTKDCFLEKVKEHVRTHFYYPKNAIDEGVQGRVYANFIIDKKGNITNMRFRSPDERLTVVARKIIETFDIAKPGIHKGKKVRVPFSIPISFKLDSPEAPGKYENYLKKKRIEWRKESDNIVPFAIVENAPEFPKCGLVSDKKSCFDKQLEKHIRKHFEFPPEAKKQGVEGTVYLFFVIGKDGEIEYTKTRSPSPILSYAAEKIINKLPTFKPGFDEGATVRVNYSTKILYSLK